MKPTFDKIFVLMLLVAFLAVASASPTGAQSPEPPEILENGEFPIDPNTIAQSITDRSQILVEGGDHGINAVTSWWSASGTTFVPASSTILYNYGSAGCVDTGASGDVWRGQVNLPHGSTIVGMWFNYQNDITDPIDTTIYLRRYSYTGDYQDILNVPGAATGTGNKTSSSFTVANNIVDNFNYAYVLVWVGNTNQNLCGVNLGFQAPPIYLSALPMIKR